MTVPMDIDGTLLKEVRQSGKHRTRQEAVDAALREYIRRKRQIRILELKGQIEYMPGYDYRILRGRIFP